MIRKLILMCRSAITGRFISKKQADDSPSTSVKERR